MNFRAAMAECMACWFLAGKLGLSVTPNPPGRNDHVLDFHVETPHDEVYAEVKAPLRERPDDGWWRDDADALVRCLKAANKQFQEGRKNLLILTPILKSGVFASRDQLTKALFGHWVVEVPIDATRPDAVDRIRHKFVHNGQLTARRRKDGKRLKPDGKPANTRISAILCIEERYVETVPHPMDWLMQRALYSRNGGGGLDTREQMDYAALERRHSDPLNQGWITHDALLIHNPNASNPITDKIWDVIPHLVDIGGRWHWSDQIVRDANPQM